MSLLSPHCSVLHKLCGERRMRIRFTSGSASLQDRLHFRICFTSGSASLQDPLHFRICFTSGSASLQDLPQTWAPTGST
ncbi:uncharacterized [Tachysurus ichikawai]